jgi:hypothetical protein
MIVHFVMGLWFRGANESHEEISANPNGKSAAKEAEHKQHHGFLSLLASQMRNATTITRTNMKQARITLSVSSQWAMSPPCESPNDTRGRAG